MSQTATAAHATTDGTPAIPRIRLFSNMDLLPAKLSREMLRYAIGRVMTCPVTGAVLDVRSAVLVESADGTRLIACVSAEGWRQHGAGVLAIVPDAVAMAEKQP